MSKRLLSAALIAGLVLAAAIPGSAVATDGTISFTGTITSATCTITGSGGNIEVPLPESVSTSALNAAAKTAGRTHFSIELTGCDPASGNVSAYFEPGAHVNAAGRLDNTATANSGIELQLRNEDTSVIDLNDNTSNKTVAGIDAAGNATLDYYVEYYANGSTIVPGAVASTLDYTIQYR